VTSEYRLAVQVAQVESVGRELPGRAAADELLELLALAQSGGQEHRETVRLADLELPPAARTV